MYDLNRIATLADVPRVHAALRPDACAQIFADERTTYAEFHQRSSQVANGLIAMGLAPQTRIAYLGKNSERFFELLFGAFKANCVMVSINWRLAPPEIEFVVNDAECEALFVGEDFHAVAAKVLPRCPGVRHVIAMDGGHPEWQDFRGWRDALPASDPELAAAADDDVIQLYTSGTTGHPKGVRLTNRNYLAAFESIEAATWGSFEPGDAVLTCMPVFHVAGTNMGICALAQGATSVVMREPDPPAILEFIPRYRINHLLLVPAVILFLTQVPTVRETDFSSVRRLLYGASPITEDLLTTAQDIFGCELFQLYGLTETTGCGTCLPPAGHAAGKLRSCGRPYPGIDIRIVDETGQSLPAGEVGEIVIRHGTVMKGYWNRDDATAAAVRDDWFHSGDAGYFDDQGYLYIHDRMKDMIVSGGENIYPAEVENAIAGHAEVADVAVIGVPDPRWGEAVKAMVVLKPGSEIDAAAIIAYARERIAGFKAPKSVEFIDALPRNPSGKILRRELRAPYWEGRQRNVN